MYNARPAPFKCIIIVSSSSCLRLCSTSRPIFDLFLYPLLASCIFIYHYHLDRFALIRPRSRPTSIYPPIHIFSHLHTFLQSFTRSYISPFLHPPHSSVQSWTINALLVSTISTRFERCRWLSFTHFSSMDISLLLDLLHCYLTQPR